VYPSTGSATSLDTALTWYQDCLATHEICKQAILPKSNWLPTRLIDIESPSGNTWTLVQGAKVLQHSTADLPRYMTLSYRWGSFLDLRLLTSTNETFMNGQPIGELPLTFRDFITVARHFGVRYLWIDRLCIIQDSSKDWEAEAVMMGAVYSNATCNIAASDAEEPTGGLFRERNVSDMQPFSLDFPVTKYYKTFCFRESNTQSWKRDMNEGPLHNRGWVFQETFLAARVLYFTRRQILWACQSRRAGEGYNLGEVIEESAPSVMRKDPKLHTATREFSDVVETYTKCKLTRGEDKLYALAGVCSVFEEVTGSRVVAGCLESVLGQQLHWYTKYPTKPATTPQRAPSWSWAAVDSPVVTGSAWIGFEDTEHTLLIDSPRISPASIPGHSADGPHGNATALSIKGRTVQYRIKTDLEGHILGQAEQVASEEAHTRGSVFPDTTELTLGAELEYEMLIYRKFEPAARLYPNIIACILLKPVLNHQATFRRVGLVHMRHAETIKWLMEEAARPCQELVLI
jgi:hypothetical protein